jgi:cell wall-associated NlpC family hydrolase
VRRLACLLALGLGLGLGGIAAGCGSVSQPATTASPARAATTTHTTAGTHITPALPQSHPQTIEPVAGSGSPAAAQPAPSAPAGVSVGPPATGLAQPVSDTQVRQQLAASGLAASANQATLTPDGLAVAPLDAPTAVQQVIAAGNEIAHLPYRWGGGHATYEDTAYDCSGSISFVFGAAHLLTGPLVSGALASWGASGPGKWITVFANAGHTFMYVAGLRFDTVALAQTGSRWSDRSATEPDLRTFAIRHPPGL